jgi:NADH-quinone oxidoreductase subunit E
MTHALQKVFSRHRAERSSLVPILQDIQEEAGYISREAMSLTASFLGIPESTVYGVVTFYAQFYLTRQGKHKIRVCQGTACHVRGSKQVMSCMEKKLGVRPGETTPDYEFTLERVACVGSCALAPLMVVDSKVHGAMTPEKAESLIDDVRKASLPEDETAAADSPSLDDRD